MEIERYIIAGLGNPGPRFENTRHNVGFDTIDLLSAKFDIPLKKNKFKALYGEGKIGGRNILLVKPQTFMNASGESIREIVDYFNVDMERLIVIFDDIDIPFGDVRIKRKGSAGTHNGMKSVIYQLVRDDFPRIKIGIGKQAEGWDLADFVLSKFSKEERKIINKSLDKAAEAAELILSGGIENAMAKINIRT